MRRTIRIALELAAGALLGLAALLALAGWRSGGPGAVDVGAAQIAVVVDHLRGERRVVARPGWVSFVPWFQEVRVLDRRPSTFTMQGDARRGGDHVPFLTARARDGSNFRFDALEIQHRLDPGGALAALDDSGGEREFRSKWIRTYARAVLRDAFGRFPTHEVADGTAMRAAKEESLARLGELLAPHGVEVVALVTPKPKFDRAYETAIEERKVADQEVERLEALAEELLRERERRLARIQKEGVLELEALRGDLAEARLAAEREEVRRRAEADAYAVARRADGEARLAELSAEAASLETGLAREAEALARAAQALEAGGEAAVREALALKLAAVPIAIALPCQERRGRAEDDR